MKIALLDASTLGNDIDLSIVKKGYDSEIYEITPKEKLEERIKDADVLIINKVKLNADNLKNAKNLKLICLAATGYDNVDTEYCKKRGIGVANVVGYSTNSVAQVTFASVLELVTHIEEFKNYVKDGSYTKSGKANKVTPAYYELAGKTWGVVGYGNIGKKVGEIAKAFGCRVVVNKRTPVPEAECVDLGKLCEISDIITLHTPLTSETKGMINAEMLAKMKKTAVLYNAARGAVNDEKAVCEAVKNHEIGAYGTDVYSVEPFGEDHPMYEIKEYPNVCLTPHMAWCSYEARCLVIEEIMENIRCYFEGNPRNIVNGVKFEK